MVKRKKTCKLIYRRIRFAKRFAKRLPLKLQLFLACMLLIIVVMYYNGNKESEHHSNLTSKSERPAYIALEKEMVDPGQLCILPRVHPFHQAIAGLFMKMKPAICDTTPQLTYVDPHGMLCLNNDGSNLNTLTVFANMHFFDCYYSEAVLVDVAKDSFRFNSSKPFTKDIDVPHADVIRVQCFVLKLFNVYQNLHMNFRNVPIIDSLAKYINKKYNVLLFGIDQLSRLNAMRQLPKTFRYLTDVLQSFTFTGYHQLGHDSFSNLLTLLTGSHPFKEPWAFPSLHDGNGKFDDLSFMWKNFSEAGYRTLLAENRPDLSIFNYKNKNFKVQPTDHYTRTFWLAAKSVLKEFSGPEDCHRNYANHQLHIEHVQSFIERMDNYDPFLAFSFIQGMTRDDVNEIGIADDDFMFFLRDLYENGNLDNTIMFFFGSQGQTFRSISETPIGRVESSMPLFTVYIPKSLKEHQPHAFRNLQANTHRLTSAYDAYATLMDIMKLSVNKPFKIGKFKTSKGVSLFGEVPSNRTCRDINIDQKYCSCVLD